MPSNAVAFGGERVPYQRRAPRWQLPRARGFRRSQGNVRDVTFSPFWAKPYQKSAWTFGRIAGAKLEAIAFGLEFFRWERKVVNVSTGSGSRCG